MPDKIKRILLKNPYFWTKQKTRTLSPPINITVFEIAEKIGKEMDRLDLLLSTTIHSGVETVLQDTILSTNNRQE